VKERIHLGWRIGDVGDVENKIIPHLVPSRDLPEQADDPDRDVIRNIPELLAMIGKGVYIRDSK
jgi:hypothetical protein